MAKSTKKSVGTKIATGRAGSTKVTLWDNGSDGQNIEISRGIKNADGSWTNHTIHLFSASDAKEIGKFIVQAGSLMKSVDNKNGVQSFEEVLAANGQ